MRRRACTIALMLLGILGMFTIAGAQAHPTSCPEFTDQSAAQTYFDAQGADYENLDTDANGIACDEPGAFSGDGPSAHPSACEDFLDQAAAQTYFDAEGEDYENLDANNNGVACDESTAAEPVTAPEDEAPVHALPVTGSGQPGESSPAIVLLAGLSAMVLTGAMLVARRFVGANR